MVQNLFFSESQNFSQQNNYLIKVRLPSPTPDSPPHPPTLKGNITFLLKYPTEKKMVLCFLFSLLPTTKYVLVSLSIVEQPEMTITVF